jgi:proline racemase
MKMRAAVLEEFGRPLAVQEVDLAEPKASEVRVKLSACGVCHTDLYTASGADPTGYTPCVLGHEGAAVVDAIGDVSPSSGTATTWSPCSRRSAANASIASAREHPSELPRLIELGRAIKADLEHDHEVVHPRGPELRDVYGVIFWQEEGEGPLTQRNVTVFADGEVDRSPCGSGTSARLALLHDEGRLATGDPLRHLSIVGSQFTGRVIEEAEEGVVTEVEGSAHLTGRHEFVLDPADELGEGFLLR